MSGLALLNGISTPMSFFTTGKFTRTLPNRFGILLSHSARNRLVMFLNTPGGSAEAVEKIVEIMRFHYSEVYFVVPDFAMSAGTILCTSGDKIFMDYSSSLGPIDPQVLPSPSSSASSLVSSRRALPFSR